MTEKFRVGLCNLWRNVPLKKKKKEKKDYEEMQIHQK